MFGNTLNMVVVVDVVAIQTKRVYKCDEIIREYCHFAVCFVYYNAVTNENALLFWLFYDFYFAYYHTLVDVVGEQIKFFFANFDILLLKLLSRLNDICGDQRSVCFAWFFCVSHNSAVQ